MDKNTGRILEKSVDDLEQIQKLWDKEVTSGIKTLNATKSEQKNNTGPNINRTGVVFADRGKAKFSYDITQEDINKYVDNAITKDNSQDYQKYAEVSEKLKQDVSKDIDLSGYTHALRDNDIRHIFNSHGEQTNEKYPVTSEDVKLIPWIVQNYDKVFVKTSANNKPGLVYVKVMPDNVIYYVEAITKEYHNEKLLVNKQMIKAGITEIPNLKNLEKAINKKESSSQYLADLLEIRKAYVQDVKENYSTNIISETTENSNRNTKNNSSKSKSSVDDTIRIDTEYMQAVENDDMETAQRLVDEVAKANGYTIKAYHGTNADFTVFDRNKVGSNTDDGIYGKGFYFSSYKNQSEQYGNSMSVYLKANNVLSLNDISREEIADLFDMWEGNFIVDNSTGVTRPSYSQVSQFTSHLIDVGYDAVYVDYGTSDEIVVFNPNQIKSADPVTYDDNGNVIPLSERFKDNQSDIRYQHSGRKSKFTNKDFNKYDDRTKLDIKQIKIYNDYGWTYQLFTAEGYLLLNETFNEKYNLHKYRNDLIFGDGTKVVEVNNKLVLIGGSFENPNIYDVFVVNSNYETEAEIIKDGVYFELEYYSRNKETFSTLAEIASTDAGEMFARNFKAEDFSYHKGQLDTGQRATLPNNFEYYGYTKQFQNRGRNSSETGEGISNNQIDKVFQMRTDGTYSNRTLLENALQSLVDEDRENVLCARTWNQSLFCLCIALQLDILSFFEGLLFTQNLWATKLKADSTAKS